MLLALQLKNYAIVDALQLEFAPGVTVITGETGAGKSVITGALGVLTGNRAEKSLIRTGAERAEIAAQFRFEGETALQIMALLDSLSIPHEENSAVCELQLRRVITPSLTRNYANDTPVGAQFLERLADCFLDIHAANEHYSLKSNAVQLAVIDRFGKHDAELRACAEAYHALQQRIAERAELLKNSASAHEIELLRAGLTQIQNAAVTPNEDAEVYERYTVAANAQELIELSAQISAILSEDENAVAAQFSELTHLFDRLEHLDAQEGAPLRESLRTLTSLLHELEADVERYGRSRVIDEAQLAMLEERLALLNTLKRRYGPTLDDVIAYAEKADEKITFFESSADRLSELDAAIAERKRLYDKSCEALRAVRQTAAQKLCTQISALLRKLGFLRADFSVVFTDAPGDANGADKAEFYFSANPGEAPGPMRQLASSGEFSRIMLAIKAVIAASDCTPVLIFDEIDANIGGEVANVVGSELKALGKNHQVICISHLAQIAACADSHIRVHKTVENDRTLTHAQYLDRAGRIAELARMLGDGPGALQHAKTLLK